MNLSYVLNVIARTGIGRGNASARGGRMNEIIAKLPETYYKTEFGAAYLGDALYSKAMLRLLDEIMSIEEV